MDIFKFSETPYYTHLSQGEIINGLTSKTWIERYDNFGEFKLVGPANLGFRELLPMYTFISHIDTKQIMVVENHEINQSKTKEPEITITGRDFNSFMEYRHLGMHREIPANEVGDVDGISLDSGTAAENARWLIRYCIEPVYLFNDFEMIYYTEVINNTVGMPGLQTILPARVLPLDNLWGEVKKLLTFSGLGIKIVRPGPWKTPSMVTLPDYNEIIIHGGLDKSETVIFSAEAGDIENADYLWSIKNSYSVGFAIGNWVSQKATTFANYSGPYYRTRILYVDGKDVDKRWTVAPTGESFQTLKSHMFELAQGSLGAHKNMAIAKLEISSESRNWRYREDYDIGDLVTVLGDYDITQKMQVTEHVEIEDKTGMRAYPTLALTDPSFV